MEGRGHGHKRKRSEAAPTKRISLPAGPQPSVSRKKSSGARRRSSSDVDVDAFLQGIADEVGVSSPTLPESTDAPVAAVAESSTTEVAAQAEALLQKLRARPAEVSRSEKIDAAWSLFKLAAASGTTATSVATPSSVLPLLLDWLQPTLARSERYVMGGSSIGTPSSTKKQSKKQKLRHDGAEDSDDESKVEERVADSGAPQFLDEAHWGLFYELLASSPNTTLPIRMEILRVLSSALLCCVGATENQRQPALDNETRLGIMRRLEAVIRLLTSSNYAQFFTSAVDNYVTYLSRASQALTYLYSQAGDSLDREMETLCLNIVLIALRKFIDVRQTMESNQKKLFGVVVGKLFEPLLSLRGLLLQRDLNVTQRNVSEDTLRSHIRRSIEDIINSALFHPDHLFEYSLAFSLKHEISAEATTTQAEGNDKKKGRAKGNKQGGASYVGNISNYRKQLFDILRGQVTAVMTVQPETGTKGHPMLILQNMPLIYRGFLDSLKAVLAAIERNQEKRAEHRNDASDDQSMDLAVDEENKRPRQHMDFHFLLELHDILKPSMSLQIGAAKLTITVRLIRDLLLLVDEYRVYEPTQDTEDKAHFRFLEHLAQHIVALLTELFNSVRDKPSKFSADQRDLAGSLFDALTSLSGLIHLTISNYMQDLWAILWNLPWQSAEAVPTACIEFSRAQLATYSKLRQMDVLLQQLLPALSAHGGGYAHYITSSRIFTKQYYDCVMQLPMGKIGTIWDIFLDEIRKTYTPQIIKHLPEAQKGDREASRQIEPLLVSLSHVINLFVGLIDSLMLVNTTAPKILDMISRTCAEVVAPLLTHALSGVPGTKMTGANDATASLVVDMLILYNALIGLREQCYRFPATHSSRKHTVSDDVRANGSCFYLLPAPDLNTLSLSELQSRLEPGLESSRYRLHFVLNVLRVQHLRRLHTFASLYALRDQPSSEIVQQSNEAEIVSLLANLQNAMEETSSRLFQELGAALPEESDRSGRRSKEEEDTSTKGWNGMLTSLSAETYGIALWKLITENIDILSLYASSDHLHLFIRVLLVDSAPPFSSTNSHGESSRSAADPFIRIEHVSRALLCKTSFYEMVRLNEGVAPVLASTVHNFVSKFKADPQVISQSTYILKLIAKDTKPDKIRIHLTRLFKSAPLSPRSNRSASGSLNEVERLYKLRDTIELILALPATFLSTIARESSSILMLVLDWFLYRAYNVSLSIQSINGGEGGTPSQIEKAVFAVRSSCRRYLSTMLTTLPSENEVLTNSIVGWLYSSLQHLDGMHPLVSHTLDVIAIHIKNNLKRSANERRENLEDILASVVDSIDQSDDEMVMEETGNNLQEIKKVCLPVSCITNVIKAMVDEYSARLGTREQRKRIKQALLVGGQPKKLPAVDIEGVCVEFVDRAEVLLLRLLGEQPLSAYLSMSKDTVTILLHSQDEKLRQTAQTYFAHLLSLAEQVLAFRHIESYRRSRDSTERKHSTGSRSIFSEVGRFASFAFRALTTAASSSALSDSEAMLCRQSLRFIKFLCSNMQDFLPQPSKPTFARFFAQIYHLMQLYADLSSGIRSRVDIARKLDACYISLLRNCPPACVRSVTCALPTELSSNSLSRLIVALNILQAILNLNEPRIVSELEGVAPILVNKLVDLVSWSAALLTPTTSSVHGNHLLHIASTSLAIITTIIGHRSFKIDSHTISRVLGAISAFSVPKRRWAIAELEFAQLHPSARLHNKRKAPISDFLPERVFLAFYSFLSKMLKIRYKQTFNCMPLFLMNARELLSNVFMAEQHHLQTARGTASPSESKAESYPYLTCARNLARLLEEVSKHPKQFNKYVAHLLVQYVQLMEVHPLSPSVKQALLPGIYSLLDICSEFEIKVVSRLVDETGRSIFRKLYEEYNRDWKFQGKA